MELVKVNNQVLLDSLIESMNFHLNTNVEKDKLKVFRIYKYPQGPSIVKLNYKNLWYECQIRSDCVEPYRQLREEVL